MNAPGSRRRVLLIVAVVAVLATGLGVVAGSRLTSPADAAARTAPPKASRITVPVEQRALASRVVARGDASFDGAVQVKVETGGLSTPPVVTGQVPVTGGTIREGKPLLEIAGRPVLALAGVLPMYRSLQPGLRGPDVLQLEQTLDRLGHDPGPVDGIYTKATAAAVARLFRAAGYQPPPVDKQLEQGVRAAEQEVSSAKSGVRSAQQQGPSRAQRVAADNAVREAQRELATAKRSGNARAIARAKDQLRLAQAQRADLYDQGDSSQLTDARKRLADANEKLTEAREAAGTPLPVSEVVYIRSLPRRVDDVKVSRGAVVNGPVMSVSGAAIVVTVKVDVQTKQLLKPGMAATFDVGDGQRVEAKIARITRSGDEFSVVLIPKRLSNQQRELLQNANVRVTIPVKSTRGKVLAVPVAALSAGSGGESRVEVVRSDGRVELVEVQVGLSAEGYAEIKPTNGELKPGDQVVVGK